MRIRPHALALAATVGAGLAAPAAAPAAEALFGVTSTNTLVTFASDSPGMVRSAVPLTGLQPGETVLALDVRPKTGQLYALGSSNRLYVVSPVSGAARAVGEQPFSPPLAGTSFGFDIHPGNDRIRVTSDGRQNLRLNPDDGAVAAQDAQLAYADGDPGAGTNPHVGSAAYTAEPESRLLGVDTARDVLVHLSAPNDGKLATVGPLNVDLQEPVSFDVAADGRGYVAGRRAGGGNSDLFVVDMATGGLSASGLLSGLSTSHGEVRAIAAAGGVPDDKTRPTVLVDLDREQSKKRLRRWVIVPVSCSEACEINTVLLSGREIAGNGSAVLDAAGAARVRLNPNRRGKRIGRKPAKGTKSKPRKLTLRVTAVDAAGNARTVRKTLVFD